MGNFLEATPHSVRSLELVHSPPTGTSSITVNPIAYEHYTKLNN